LFFNSNANNIYQRSNGKTYWQFQSLAQYKITTQKGEGSLFGDPLFANSAAGNFYLEANSPAIDHGVNTGMLIDLAGNVRQQGINFDIGAYEFLNVRLP